MASRATQPVQKMPPATPNNPSSRRGQTSDKISAWKGPGSNRASETPSREIFRLCLRSQRSTTGTCIATCHLWLVACLCFYKSKPQSSPLSSCCCRPKRSTATRNKSEKWRPTMREGGGEPSGEDEEHGHASLHRTTLVEGSYCSFWYC